MNWLLVALTMLDIKLNRRSSQELSQQLYEQIKALVLSGNLRPGARIPSSRDLAQSLKVSRPTVAAGLAQLEAEGYLNVVHGSGVYVSPELPGRRRRGVSGEETASAKPTRGAGRGAGRSSVASDVTIEHQLSEYGTFVRALSEKFDGIAQKEPEIAFYCWRPALDQFPSVEWARIVGKHARACEETDFDDTAEPAGILALRKAIAGLAQRFRGVSCTSDQVIILNGVNQGIDLVARMHLESGISAAVEDPGYHVARSLFSACGARVIPVPVDEDGLSVADLSASARRNCRLLYVTPSHQFPTGATMTLARRLKLLQWAKQAAAVVLEDDYDSEFHASAKPIPALMSLDKHESVLYLGALNQLMFPSLGLAYLIVPPSLVRSYARARDLTGVQLPPHLQAAIAEFIDSGLLERHVKRLSNLYSQRRACLVQALEKHLEQQVTIRGTSAGVFVLATFDTRLSIEEIRKRALQAGVGLIDTRPFYADKQSSREFILGFGSLTEKKIEEGVRRIARALR